MWTNVSSNTKTGQQRLNLWRSLMLSLCLMMVAIPLWAQDFPDPNAADDRIAVANLNVDDAITLATLLTGIGETRAQAIVAYREENGPFASIDDLANVAGIGPATVAANRDRMVVTDPNLP
jgi:competence protein ComEA